MILVCSKCGYSENIPNSKSGLTATCKTCGTTFVVPSPPQKNTPYIYYSVVITALLLLVIFNQATKSDLCRNKDSIPPGLDEFVASIRKEAEPEGLNEFVASLRKESNTISKNKISNQYAISPNLSHKITTTKPSYSYSYPTHFNQYYYGNSCDSHWIKSIDSSNGILTLEDGSVWKTTSYDRYKTITWLPMDDIIVSEGSYSPILINKDQGEVVESDILAR